MYVLQRPLTWILPLFYHNETIIIELTISTDFPPYINITVPKMHSALLPCTENLGLGSPTDLNIKPKRYVSFRLIR